MKYFLAAFLTALLAGCAAQPLRSTALSENPSAPPPLTTPPATSPVGFSGTRADPADIPSPGRRFDAPPNPAGKSSSAEVRLQSPDPRLFESADPASDRLPSPLAGTSFDSTRFNLTPAQAARQWGAPPVATATPYPGQLISYSFSPNPMVASTIVQSPQSGDFVYLPDPGSGPSGEATGVTIGESPCPDNQTFFERLEQRPLVYNLLNDQLNFYSCCSLEWLAAGLGTSAILANTNLDEQFRQAVHGPANSKNHDLAWAKDLGTGQYVIPGLVAIYAADYWLDDNAAPGERPVAECLEQWSGRSLRGLVVGAVPVVALQYIIGSSRPGESSAGSRWKPFQDNNGVSGHAFVGAVPLWTAAQMTDNIPLQAAFYAGGTLAGISRIHDDAHFLSQVVMGWWIAGLSVAAVDNTEWQKRQWQVTPLMMENGTGIGVTHQW